MPALLNQEIIKGVIREVIVNPATRDKAASIEVVQTAD